MGKLDDEHLRVVVIGGSLAGLMHGIMLKRLGHDVRIVERSCSLRRDQAAGITAGPDAQKFLERYDLTNQPYSVPSPGIQMIDKDSKTKRFFKMDMQMTGWSVLYYRLRANFDGLPSDHCQQPPPSLENDGKAIFDSEKQVTEITYADNVVTVRFQDQSNHHVGSIQADMVIAADGSNSTVRRLLLPNVTRPYAGYVAWRGTVLESRISNKHREIFAENVPVFKFPNNYILGYKIPGDKGSLEPDERLLNYVWYSKCPESSPDYARILTDIDGHQHRNTVPIGKVRSEVWAAQRDYGISNLASLFAELVEKTENPFLTTISDNVISQAVFFDGRLFIVGDALSLFRPHVALGTNQSALHCLLLEEVMAKKMSALDWEKTVLRYGRANRILSNAVGEFGLGGWTFLAELGRYIREIIKQRILGLFGL